MAVQCHVRALAVRDQRCLTRAAALMLWKVGLLYWMHREVGNGKGFEV